MISKHQFHAGSATELKIKDHNKTGEKEEVKKLETSKTSLPRNASQPAFSTQVPVSYSILIFVN